LLRNVSSLPEGRQEQEGRENIPSSPKVLANIPVVIRGFEGLALVACYLTIARISRVRDKIIEILNHKLGHGSNKIDLPIVPKTVVPICYKGHGRRGNQHHPT
jgi:hypothetical protein